MACEKYLAWMTDAPLGALAPGREPELLAHTATCDTCHEAYQRARDVAAFVDRGVASLVSGNPSPHFATRLRARLAEQAAPARINWLAAVIPVAPASRRLFSLAAAAVVLTVVLFIALARTTPPTNSNHVAEVIPENPSPAAAANIPLAPASVAPARTPGFVRHASPRSLPAQEPEVLVEPGQFAAVMQFTDAVRAGRMDGAGLLAADQPLEKPLDVAPIEISPLETSQIETPSAPPAENLGRR